MEKQRVKHGELDYMRDNAGYNNCNCKLMITNKMPKFKLILGKYIRKQLL